MKETIKYWEDGNDVLYGVIGNDIMRGGLDANEFICGTGVDTVLGYNPAKGDTISNDCEIVNTESWKGARSLV